MMSELLSFLFLKQAPFLPSAQDLGILTCPVKPWPHQLRVVREVVRRFPESFLFSDEVGLGKTIEAGLALRQLVLSGRVQRALLLVPSALLQQWQEELHEKLVLSLPRFDGSRFLDVAGRELPMPDVTNPWNAHPLTLASTQLARREDRREQLLAAKPWDLILVDEAHHARRRGFRSLAPSPNRLLQLLAGTPGKAGLKDRTRALYLLTATPMQLHPLETWDLLRLLGLGGRWGAQESHFLAWFEELRRPFDERDWSLIFDLFEESLELNEGVDLQQIDRLAKSLQPEQRQLLREVLAPELRQSTIYRALTPDTRQILDAILQHHTPLRTFVWRNTRDLLHLYRQRGLLKASIPRRLPTNVWIDFRPEEQTLYEQIDTYLGEIYRRYEARRRGLGFVATVYRRRLTSSFYAVRRSLKRRLEWLCAPQALEDPTKNPSGLLSSDLVDHPISKEGGTLEKGGGTFESAEKEGGTFEKGHGNERGSWGLDLFADSRQEEIQWLESFLTDLTALSEDSKLTQLKKDLETLLPQRPSALLFTQYTDTLDHLREALRKDYGDAVACYSGRGGEVWNGAGWRNCPKEDLKERFRTGSICILLATEAAGEGLNLQTCGLLINYDMPWNPMRVEQRIGRIDRIGQVYDEVWIRNYFYRDTVEAEIYRRLSHRIDWFEEVVGTLQPILQRVGDSLRELAMTPASRRARRLEQELEELERELDAPTPENFLPETHQPPEPQPLASPVDCQLIESIVLNSTHLAPLLRPDPDLEGAWLLEGKLDGEPPSQPTRRVTFRPELFDRYPYSLELLTYGNPLFHRLLETVPSPPAGETPHGLGLYHSRHPAPVSLFLLPTPEGARGVETWQDITDATPGLWRSAQEGAASTLFSRKRREVLERRNRVIERRRRDRSRALVQAANRVLRETALIELARDRTPTLFDEPLPYGFGEEAVRALERHGPPFSELLKIARDALPTALENDPFFHTVEGRSPAHLDNRWTALCDQGTELVQELRQIEEALEEARRNLREPSAGGLLERTFFPLGEGDIPNPVTLLDPANLEPFVNAVPFFVDLTEALWWIVDAEGPPFEELARQPESGEWIAATRRHRPAPGLFAATVTHTDLTERIPPGSLALFRCLQQANRTHIPRNGQVVLASHPHLRDPELGSGLALRIFSIDSSRHQVILATALGSSGTETLRLEEDEAAELVLHAELLELLS